MSNAIGGCNGTGFHQLIENDGVPLSVCNRSCGIQLARLQTRSKSLTNSNDITLLHGCH